MPGTLLEALDEAGRDVLCHHTAVSSNAATPPQFLPQSYSSEADELWAAAGGYCGCCAL